MVRDLIAAASLFLVWVKSLVRSYLQTLRMNIVRGYKKDEMIPPSRLELFLGLHPNCQPLGEGRHTETVEQVRTDHSGCLSTLLWCGVGVSWQAGR